MSKQYSITRSFSQSIGRAATCLVALFIFTAMAGAATHTVDTPDTKSVPNTRTIGNRGALTDTLFRVQEYEVFGAATVYDTLTAVNDPKPVTIFSPTATFPVTNANDSGAGSLRQAITNANATAGADTISFDIADAGPHVIQLASVLPDISESVDILNTSNESVTVKGNGSTGGFRVFRINLGAVTIRNLIISNGYADNYGGGIYNGSSGRLTLTNSTVSGNTAESDGGGIANYGGNLIVANSTVSGNSAYRGGGIMSFIFSDSTFTTTITNSTVNGNSADRDGGNIYTFSSRVTLRGSIIANGTAIFGPDIESDAGIISEGYNLIEETSGIQTTLETANAGTNIYGLDPNLGPLANNGGTTQTHALLACSPAIDKGKNFSGSTTDQRTLTRTVNGVNYPNAPGGDGTDIGAFEVQQPDVPTAPTVTINQAAGQSDPTGSSPINFTVVFSQSVSNFATGDVTLSGTAGATTATVTGSGTTYNVAVSGMTFDGTVIASINAGVATGACSGTANTASTSTDNTVQYNAPDTTAPTVTSIDDGDADNTVQINETLTYTVTFSKDINASTVTAADFNNAGTASITIGTITETTATSGVFTVRVTPTTNGSIILRIPTGADIRDTLNNALVTPISDDTTVTVGLFDLTVTKTHTGNFTQGGVGTYTIIAKNSGGGAYSGTIIVNDFLPDGLTVKLIEVGAGWNCATDDLRKAFSCDRTAVLAAGASYPSITFTVDVAANAPSSVTNTASVSGSGESNKTNNTASDLTIINAATTFSISGTVRYGITDAGQTPAAISGVNLNAAGTANASAISDTSGIYQLSNLASGNYTVTPTKTGEIKGVNSLDATRIQQHRVGLITLTPNQLIAADTDGSGAVNSLDATRIQQRAVGIIAQNIIGQWKFVPSSKQYNSISGNVTGEDYQAVLVGEVSGNWATASSFADDSEMEEEMLPKQDNLIDTATRLDNELIEQTDGRIKQSADLKANDSQSETATAGAGAVNVSLPTNAKAATGSTITVPITIGAVAADSSIESIDFTVFYNPAVLQPTAAVGSNAGTLSNGCSVLPNSPISGRVIVSGACAQAITSATGGVLYNLQFTVLGAANQTSALTFVNASNNTNTFQFNNGTPSAVTNIGQFTVFAPTAASVTVSGRVTNDQGRGIRNVTIILTDSNGNQRTAQPTSFGYYNFSNIEAGETVTITAKARRFKFLQSTIVRTTNQSVTDADFVSEP
jgi:hypothetical protein